MAWALVKCVVVYGLGSCEVRSSVCMGSCELCSSVMVKEMGLTLWREISGINVSVEEHKETRSIFEMSCVIGVVTAPMVMFLSGNKMLHMCLAVPLCCNFKKVNTFDACGLAQGISS